MENGVRCLNLPTFTGKNVDGVLHIKQMNGVSCTPLECIKLFWADELSSYIVRELNYYASKKSDVRLQDWKDVLVLESQIWLSILLFMSVVQCTEIADYWKKVFKLRY